MAADDPGRKNIKIRTGNTFRKTFMWGEPGARKITDLVITDGSTTATAEPEDGFTGFNEDDTGKKLVLQDGVGVADGTTMTYVSATEVTLSAPATATRENVRAVVRGMNASLYTNHKAQFKRKRGDTTEVAEFNVDSTRSAVGVFVLTMTAAVTSLLTGNGGWDWQYKTPDGDDGTWVEGPVRVQRDWTQ